jgi:hypothetical protein
MDFQSLRSLRPGLLGMYKRIRFEDLVFGRELDLTG